MIDSGIHRNMKIARGGSVPKTRLLRPSTQYIIIAMTGDRPDELGSQFLRHLDFYHQFLFCSVLFLDTKLHIPYECSLCASFIAASTEVTICLSVKTFISRKVHLVFSLVIFVFAHLEELKFHELRRLTCFQTFV